MYIIIYGFVVPICVPIVRNFDDGDGLGSRFQFGDKLLLDLMLLFQLPIIDVKGVRILWSVPSEQINTHD